MTQESQIDAIKARKKEIAAEIERLQSEGDELDIALRVLSRFSEERAETSASSNRLGPPRPEGTPSLFEMTDIVLRDAMSNGKSGLKGQEIVGAIGRKFWPGVQSKQVLPPIYQFAKRGRLHKTESGVFKLIEKQKSAP